MVKVGRKTKYTPQTVNKIVKYLKDGNSLDRSARLSGINPSTLYVWLKEKPELIEDIEKAKEYNIATRLKRITKHARTNWQADAWVLERTRPQEFALKTIQEIQGKDGQELVFKIVADTPKIEAIQGIDQEVIEGNTEDKNKKLDQPE